MSLTRHSRYPIRTLRLYHSESGIRTTNYFVKLIQSLHIRDLQQGLRSLPDVLAEIILFMLRLGEAAKYHLGQFDVVNMQMKTIYCEPFPIYSEVVTYPLVPITSPRGFGYFIRDLTYRGADEGYLNANELGSFHRLSFGFCSRCGEMLIYYTHAPWRTPENADLEAFGCPRRCVPLQLNDQLLEMMHETDVIAQRLHI